MEELRSLKKLYEEGYVVESEYNRRRLALINKITGKNYTMEDILKAENRSGASAAPAPAPTPAPAPVQPVQPVQMPAPSSPMRQPAHDLRAPMADLAAPVPGPVAATHSQEQQQRLTITPPDIYSGGNDLDLEEIPADQLEIWDDLDALTLEGKQAQNSNSGAMYGSQPQQGGQQYALPPGGVRPSDRSALKAAPGLQPTSAFPTQSDPASSGNANASTPKPTLRATPTATDYQQTLRSQGANAQAHNASTLRQPAALVNDNEAAQGGQYYNQQQQQQMAMGGGYGMGGGQMGINTANSMNAGAYGSGGQYGSGGPMQGGNPMMGMNMGNTMYGGNPMMGMNNTMYGGGYGGMQGQMGGYGMQGQGGYGYPMMGMQGQMGMNQANTMNGGGYGGPMGMQGQGGYPGMGNTVYGDQMGMQGQMNMQGQGAGGYPGGGPMGMQGQGGTMRSGASMRSTISETPSEFRNTPSLESNAMAGKSTVKRMAGGKADTPESYTWEFFHAAGNNNVKRLNELLELGVDVNQIDTDTGNTALHMACTKGQKHALFFLVDEGADIEAQNKKGSTPLHLLVTHRFNNLVTWMVKQGADITVEDARGFTPYDMALPWLQKEMKEAVYGRQRSQKTQQQINRTFGALADDANPELRREVNFNKMQDMGINMDTLRNREMGGGVGGGGGGGAPMGGGAMAGASMGAGAGMGGGMSAAPSGGGASIPKAQSKPAEQEVMKIYLKNKAYKSLLITSDTHAGDVCTMMADKLGMSEHHTSFDLVDVQKDVERRLDPSANLFKIKKFWPLILGKKGENETNKHCYFMVVPKRGTSSAVQKLYRKAIS